MASDIRPRFDGPIQKLAAALLQVADRPGFLKYCEEEKVHKSKLQVSRILEQRALVKQLLEVDPTVCFKKKYLNEALTVVVDAKTDWEFTAADRADWLVTMTRRLCNLCAHVRDGISNQRSWITQTADEVGITSQEVTFEYGFNVELNAAFRKPTNDKNAKPEYAIRLEAQEGDDHPTATFEDGATELITEITSAELEHRRCPRQGARRTDPATSFELVHHSTHHRLRGFIKSDRVPLFILQEQNKQILQISMTKCKNENHVADIMRSIAMQYASGEIERSMLKEKRDEVLKSFLKNKKRLPRHPSLHP